TLGLAAHVDFDGSGAVQATLHGAVPSLTVRRGADTVVLRADKLEAKLHSDAQTTGVEISTLRLAAPRLQLSGRSDLHHTTPMATLGIHAGDLDIASVHRAWSVLLGNGGLAGEIFNVLRAGIVPQFSLRLQAPSMAQWGDRQALAIHGRLVAGRIGIPGVNLELQDVAG